jgi:fucose permease
MFSLLLALIYLAFISLGLPDSLVGSAWPVMQVDLSVPSSYAGIVTMTIAGGTIISSLASDWLTKRLGAGLVTAVSVLLTALGLLGFSFSSQFYMLCLWAVPYGLGAGAIDAALNNYVAIHYSARHMNWLHCCWGIGASISPYIMGWSLGNGWGWPNGFRIVFYIQICLAAIMFISLPLWKREKEKDFGDLKEGKDTQMEKPKGKKGGTFRSLAIPGVLPLLLAFFGYCALESTAGLWASSYLVGVDQVDAVSASRFASFFYLGITCGRAISGIIAGKLSDRQLIRIGLGIMALGLLMIGLPLGVTWLPLAGLITLGLGCGPVYPSVIHATPFNFGKENSQAIVGIEMASAYVGSTFMPPLFGLLAQNTSLVWYPLYMGGFALLTTVMTEVLNRIVSNRERKSAMADQA